MNERDDKEENKTTWFSTNFLRAQIQAINDSFLVFLVALVLSVFATFWLLPEYMKQFPILLAYIALVIVLAALGMWTYLAPVRRERDRLLAERRRLLKDLRDARDDRRRLLKLIERVLPAKTSETPL